MYFQLDPAYFFCRSIQKSLGMGKKNKKSFYKKQLKPLMKGNGILLAALGGAAAGITLASILGTEKAQQMLHTVEDSIAGFSERVSRGLNSGSRHGNAMETETKRDSVTS